MSYPRPNRPTCPDRHTPVRRGAAARPLGLAASLLCVLLVAGCSDGEDLPEASPTAPGGGATASAAPAPTEPETTEPEPTTSEPDVPTDDADETGGGVGDLGTWATFTAEPPPVPRDDAEEVFGDDPRVQLVRTFNEEFARAATDGDPQHPEWVSTMSDEGYEQVMTVLEGEFGLTYPGPLPFTLLGVAELDDGTSSVQGCVMSAGFALGAGVEDGGEGFTGSVITPLEYSLVENPAGEWLVDALYAGTYDCSTMTVEARTW